MKTMQGNNSLDVAEHVVGHEHVGRGEDDIHQEEVIKDAAAAYQWVPVLMIARG